MHHIPKTVENLRNHKVEVRQLRSVDTQRATQQKGQASQGSSCRVPCREQTAKGHLKSEPGNTGAPHWQFHLQDWAQLTHEKISATEEKAASTENLAMKCRF